MTRIFTACHGTQLLVILHLRRHLQLPQAKEFLVWHPYGDAPSVDSFMQSIISTAGFTATLDIRNFESLKPRTSGPLTWWLESVRRLRHDAATIHRWMKKNQINEDEVELWADEPIHWNVRILRGLLRNARHIKFPHCFNHEDASTAQLKDIMESKWRALAWPHKYVFLPWQRWTSGVDLRMEKINYHRAYTFDRPSWWAKDSVEVANLISMPAFRQTYETLPVSLRQQVEATLSPLVGCRRPLVLLLLFGIDSRGMQMYRTAIARLFRERSEELTNCSLAVKMHPSGSGDDEETLIEWMKNNIPATIFTIRSNLNLEFMLPQVRPDFVWAGPCGALPIVQRLRAGRVIALAEVFFEYSKAFPNERQLSWDILRYAEVW